MAHRIHSFQLVLIIKWIQQTINSSCCFPHHIGFMPRTLNAQCTQHDSQQLNRCCAANTLRRSRNENRLWSDVVEEKLTAWTLNGDVGTFVLTISLAFVRQTQPLRSFSSAMFCRILCLHFAIGRRDVIKTLICGLCTLCALKRITSCWIC